jgi:hypothetical protein
MQAPSRGYCVVSAHALTAIRHRFTLVGAEASLFQLLVGWRATCTSHAAATAATEDSLRLFAITRAGLLAITVCVCALWACIGMEKVTVARTNVEITRTFLQLQKLRRSAEIPVESPVTPRFLHHHQTNLS